MTLRKFLQSYLNDRNAARQERLAKLKELGAPKVIIEHEEKRIEKLDSFPGATKFKALLDEEVIRHRACEYKYFTIHAPGAYPTVSKTARKIYMDDAVLVFIPETCSLLQYNDEYDCAGF